MLTVDYFDLVSDFELIVSLVVGVGVIGVVVLFVGVTRSEFGTGVGVIVTGVTGTGIGYTGTSSGFGHCEKINGLQFGALS